MVTILTGIDGVGLGVGDFGPQPFGRTFVRRRVRRRRVRPFGLVLIRRDFEVEGKRRSTASFGRRTSRVPVRFVLRRRAEESPFPRCVPQ